VEYQQIAAAGFLPAPSTDVLFLPCGGVSVLERCGRGMSGLVFGTLLGPEATGPGGAAAFGCGAFPGFVCFWFPGCTDHTVDSFFGGCVWGVWYGVVV
jgi:hypothetical protein